jgi:hypothetical protein
MVSIVAMTLGLLVLEVEDAVLVEQRAAVGRDREGR